MTRKFGLGKFLAPIALAGLFAATLAATAQPSSAMIACNKLNECWHVREYYVYRPEYGVSVHPVNWRWKQHEHFRWHEHAGRGYWLNGIWVSF
jgi:hypothetical protein